jgi:nicotinamide mononucleotide adenylyltransferase
MDIDLTDFTPPQQQALFDLLVLTMFADSHLTTFEDDHLQQLLIAMGHTEESDRQKVFDAAVTRMRPHVQSIQKAREQTIKLVEVFATRQQHKQVYAAVEDMITSDGHVTSWETALLSELRQRFRL